jgi:hypothetical protein
MAERTFTPIAETDIAESGEVFTQGAKIESAPKPEIGTPEYSRWAYTKDVKQTEDTARLEANRQAEIRERETMQRATAPVVPEAVMELEPWEFVGLPTAKGFYEMLGSSEFWERDVKPRWEESLAAVPLAVVGSAVDIPVTMGHIVRYFGEQARGNPNDFGFFKDFPDLSKIKGSTDWYGTQLGYDIESPSFIAPQLISPTVFEGGGAAMVAKGASKLLGDGATQLATLITGPMWGTVNNALAKSSAKSDHLLYEKRITDRVHAITLEKKGANMDEIWKATNWIKIDGEWKFWLDSSKTTINPDPIIAAVDDYAREVGPNIKDHTTFGVRLGDFWDATDLYDTNEAIADIIVDLGAYFYRTPEELKAAEKAGIEILYSSDGHAFGLAPAKNTSTVGGMIAHPDRPIEFTTVKSTVAKNLDTLRTTMAHEVGGHVVQMMAKWPNGASAANFFEDGRQQEVVQFIMDDYLDLVWHNPNTVPSPDQVKTIMRGDPVFSGLVAHYALVPYKSELHNPALIYNDPSSILRRNMDSMSMLDEAAGQPRKTLWSELADKEYTGKTVLDVMVNEAIKRRKKYKMTSDALTPEENVRKYNEYAQVRDDKLRKVEELMRVLNIEYDNPRGGFHEAIAQLASSFPKIPKSGQLHAYRYDRNAYLWYTYHKGEAFARLNELGATPEGAKFMQEEGFLAGVYRAMYGEDPAYTGKFEWGPGGTIIDPITGKSPFIEGDVQVRTVKDSIKESFSKLSDIPMETKDLQTLLEVISKYDPNIVRAISTLEAGGKLPDLTTLSDITPQDYFGKLKPEDLVQGMTEQ